jgi:hypothetical protein
VTVATITKRPWRLISDVDILDMPDSEFLIDGVLPRRGLVCLYGPPGAGKTTVLADMAVAVATKTNFFGQAVLHQGATVYAGTDDPHGWKPRLLAKKADAGLDLNTAIGVYLFAEPLNLLDAAAVEAFIAFIVGAGAERGMPIELLMIDTYAASTPGASENSSEDTTRAIVNAQRLRDALGATVVLAHHTNAGGSRERGHSAIRGAMDTMLALVPADDIVKLECNKQRNAAPFKAINLKMTDGQGGCLLRLASDVAPNADLSTNQRKVLDCLTENFASTGATKAEWRSSCQDIAERTFHRACKVLQDLHLVRVSGARFIPVEVVH